MRRSPRRTCRTASQAVGSSCRGRGGGTRSRRRRGPGWGPSAPALAQFGEVGADQRRRRWHGLGVAGGAPAFPPLPAQVVHRGGWTRRASSCTASAMRSASCDGQPVGQLDWRAVGGGGQGFSGGRDHPQVVGVVRSRRFDGPSRGAVPALGTGAGRGRWSRALSWPGKEQFLPTRSNHQTKQGRGSTGSTALTSSGGRI